MEKKKIQIHRYSSTSYLVKKKKNSCFRLSPLEHKLSFREARILLLAPPVNTYVISIIFLLFIYKLRLIIKLIAKSFCED